MRVAQLENMISQIEPSKPIYYRYKSGRSTYSSDNRDYHREGVDDDPRIWFDAYVLKPFYTYPPRYVVAVERVSKGESIRDVVKSSGSIQLKQLRQIVKTNLDSERDKIDAQLYPVYRMLELFHDAFSNG